jgi:hypothetical protein
MPKIPVSTLRRGLPQIPINVTNVALRETERHGDVNDPEKGNRADVYFGGTITVNGKLLPCIVHLFRVDKEGWQKGSWYVTMNVNENVNWNKNIPTRDMFEALPEHCTNCHKEGYVGKAFAAAIFPLLRSKGFNLASGIGYKGSKCDWWLMNVTCEKQGPRIAGNRPSRSFYYKQRRQVTCPVHGEFIQETEESSL